MHTILVAVVKTKVVTRHSLSRGGEKGSRGTILFNKQGLFVTGRVVVAIVFARGGSGRGEGGGERERVNC